MSVPPQIGNYKLDREIGRGASSEVWLARHTHLKDHQVAVKILMSQDRDAVRRFQREASIAARMRHPNIVQLFDHSYQQPFYYTVLEYVPGGSLRQLLERRRRLPLEEALSIFRQIAAALDYAHGLGIIHRDVSPGNILIEQNTQRILLADFGIARDPEQPITIASSIMGTPGYLSPEHTHSATSVTHLSDLFSLGVVLYQMLAGELPWPDQPILTDGVTYDINRSLQERGVEGLPSDVDRVLRTLLAIDPTRRFPSARAAVAELERIFQRHHSATQVLTPGAPLARAAAPGAFQYQSGGVEPNAVEGVLGPDLLRAPIDRAHRRAEELRDPTVVAALLDSWAARSRLHLPLLGRRARLHKVSSRNVYFFRLKVLYERRSAGDPKEEPDRKQQVFPITPEADRWDVSLPAVGEFADHPGAQVDLPGSTRVVICQPCGGRGAIVCPRCNGKQRVYVNRPAPAPAAAPAPAVAARVGSPVSPAPASAAPRTPSAEATSTAERVLLPCPECSGRGGKTCDRCDGVGRLVQRKTFVWQRSSQIFRAQTDLPEVDEEWLARTCKSEVIYTERHHGAARPTWPLVPVLAELLTDVNAQAGPDTRVVLSELSISFIPVTDIVFDLGRPGDSGLYRLAIYGFENLIPIDWRFLHWERVIFLSITLFLLLITVVLAAFALA